MKRREFTSLLGGAISGAVWPWNGLALSPLKRPLIGFLALASRVTGEQFLSGFPQGMRGFGYLEGRDFGFEARYANEDVTRLSRLAEDLVRTPTRRHCRRSYSPSVSLETGNLHPSDCWSQLVQPRWIGTDREQVASWNKRHRNYG